MSLPLVEVTREESGDGILKGLTFELVVRKPGVLTGSVFGALGIMLSLRKGQSSRWVDGWNLVIIGISLFLLILRFTLRASRGEE